MACHGEKEVVGGQGEEQTAGLLLISQWRYGQASRDLTWTAAGIEVAPKVCSWK